MRLDKFKLALDKNLSLGNLLERLAELRGDENYLTLHRPIDYAGFPNNRFSYNEMSAFCDRAASALVDLGIKPGDRVGIATQNDGDLHMLIMAIMRAKGIAVPMNFMLKGKEMAYMIENSGAQTMIVDEAVFKVNIKDKAIMPGVKQWIMTPTRGDKGVPEGFISLDEAMQKASPKPPKFEYKPSDKVAIFFTSGTTGFPKGAYMTSDNLLLAQKIVAAILPVGGTPSLFSLPASHVFGFGSYLIGLCVGLRTYFLPHFNASDALEIIDREKIGLFVGVPAMFVMMKDHGIDGFDLSSLKMLGSAADAMPKQIADEFCARGSLFKFGPWRQKAFFTECYGMVELAGAATMKVAIMGIDYPQGCVGWPVFPVKMKIVDDEGRKLKAGEVGEVLVGGPGVCQGYWNNPEATAELIQDGWLRTGDMGFKDKLGRLNFVDRKKDVIKSGGYSIFSVEVERELLDHPAVSEVAVVGVPHPLKKQVPIAVLTLHPGMEATEEEVLAWGKEHIAAYKAPKAVRILKPEDMPYGNTLKVLKRELRDRYADIFEGADN
jgi:long-chain acyl-CoA synthetase